MLHRKRGDYLSRSVLEIFEEENVFPELNLTIEQELSIYYPAAYYFYVAKDNTELAEAIESGLKTAIADGSFDEIFNRYFAEEIKKAKLTNRRVIQIPFSNTDFIDQSNPDFWFKPEKAEAL